MKLKGVKKLNKAITSLVHDYITDEVDCKFNTNFCVLDDVVYYSLMQDEMTDRIWALWLAQTYGDRYQANFSTFVLSFLHEIGHFYTIDDFDDEEEEIEQKKSLLIVNYDTDTDAEIAQKNFDYWELPVEKAATDWAINFYNNHIPEMRNFYTKMMNAIVEFYSDNQCWD